MNLYALFFCSPISWFAYKGLYLMRNQFPTKIEQKRGSYADMHVLYGVDDTRRSRPKTSSLSTNFISYDLPLSPCSYFSFTLFEYILNLH